MSLRILSAANVEHLVANLLPLSELLTATGRLFHQVSHEPESISCPLRTSVDMTGYTLLSMPAHVSGLGTSVKLVAVPRGHDHHHSGSEAPRRAPGLPATTILVEDGSGVSKCILNARHLTALRTAAGSLLATQLLLNNNGRPPPTTLALFGAGLQIQYHADLMLRQFPSITTCYILTRSTNTTRARYLYSRLLEAHQHHPAKQIQLIPITRDQGEEDGGYRIPRARSATLEADILCFATSSTTPLVESDWIKDGAHLVLVGSYTPSMHEVPIDVVKRASKVVVDAREHAIHEAGELIAAQLDPQRDLLELGELVGTEGDPVTETIQAAQNGNITIFKSVGLAAQDVMIAQLVTCLAEAHSIGTVIDDFD